MAIVSLWQIAQLQQVQNKAALWLVMKKENDINNTSPQETSLATFETPLPV